MLNAHGSYRMTRIRLFLQALNAAVRSGADDVKAAALETLGNLAFARPNRVVLLACEGLREWLARLAEAQVRLVMLCIGFKSPCLQLER